MNGASQDNTTPPSDDLAHQLAKVCWEALHLDQARRWRLGQRLPAEAYLRHLPDLAADATGRIDQIYNEVLLRRNLGETPTADEYLRRFPDQAQELRDQLEFDDCFPSPQGPLGDAIRQA